MKLASFVEQHLISDIHLNYWVWSNKMASYRKQLAVVADRTRYIGQETEQ